MPQSFISTPVNVTGASATAPTHIASVQIPSAGKWDVTYFVKMTGTPGGAALYGQGGGLYGNTEISGTKGTGVNESSAVGRATITTTGAQTLNLRGWGTYQAVSGATGRTGLTAELVVGQVGPQGIQGKPGNNGVAGADGKDGAKGDKGEQGIAGANGANGTNGAKGETGAQGPKGDTGATGSQGLKGDQGFVGPKGDAGTNGTPGLPGARGQEGTAGRSVTVHIQQRAPINSDGVAGDIWYQY